MGGECKDENINIERMKKRESDEGRRERERELAEGW